MALATYSTPFANRQKSYKKACKLSVKRKRTTITDAWMQLFEANESAVFKYSDAQLRSIMQKTFPAKATADSICRVSWVRCMYNNGTGMFARYGAPAVRSRSYNDD